MMAGPAPEARENRPPRALRMVRVECIREECPGVVTLLFRDSLPMDPGQFYMVWLPGVDEIPLSASVTSPGDLRGVTVADVGECTHGLTSLAEGDRIGIRGPYGRGWDVHDDWLWVGGGVGASPVMAGFSAVVDRGMKGTLVLGAGSGGKLVLALRAVERMTSCVEGGTDPTSAIAGAPPGDGCAAVSGTGSLHICTDDGSAGFRGLASKMAHELIMKRKERDVPLFGGIAACGPEPMLVTLLELARLHGLPSQLSLERHMKCALGICDSCSIDGMQVCRDGPVFHGRQLEAVGEFGSIMRAPSGARIHIVKNSRRRSGENERA